MTGRRTNPKSTRCAIYTRKSTEEGLEQDFNSLDAQRQGTEIMPQLSDTQAVLLSAAAARRDFSVLPPPDTVRLKGAALDRTLRALVTRGLIAEEAKGSKWASNRLVVTPSGLAAIGVETAESAREVPVAASDREKQTHPEGSQRPGGKLGVLLAAVARPEGATLGDLTAASGWLPHTTRAALTRLRQRGYDVRLANTGTRLLATIPVVAVVALAVFSILYFAPGDPAVIMAGDNASEAEIQQARAELGLDRGYLARFAIWSGHVLTGDFGTSIYSKLPVTSLIAQRMLPTASMIVLTLLLAVAIAVPLGAVAASRHRTSVDRFAMLLAVLGFSLPSFVVAYILAYYFGLRLRWLPIQGFLPPSAGFGQYLASILLPAASLSFLYIALISRITRSAMLDVLSQDYIRTARAKGLSEWMVVFVHALKNAAVPITTVVGLGFASLLGGAVVIETVFAIPGLGQLMVNSILARDYPVIQGVLLLFSVSYVLVNLCVDLLYAVFDPRIRY